jgi:hypothetical protein
MPQNGEINEGSGLYKTVCCGVEIFINTGSTFPDCPNHRKLTTIWKAVEKGPIVAQMAKKRQPEFAAEPHIENRRLFNVAAGDARLSELEQQHLHEYKVCNGVLYVFAKQPINSSAKNQPNPGEAA